MSDTALKLVDLRKGFDAGQGRLEVLRGATIEVARGEVIALLGPSGAGKSTLLHIAGLLEAADSGEIILAGKSCARLSDFERTAIRRETVGFVYQFHNLLPEFSAADNVALPQMVAGKSQSAARARAKELLSRLGLGQRLEHYPSQLSGGEQQRVAICRALANKPKILFADEPTGNLDEATADAVFAELLRVAREDGVGALIATHNGALADRMDRRILLHNGMIEAG
ncbi:ABC transporter ATP-binding protein [Emcibacter sp. SYSU 3D8]|uniref:ABC transporter ATP-binding protein n=1 Tax=Emcibacter sp. SYSU 3D8 TaxID=3133969 RepID=UPI0031FF1D03